MNPLLGPQELANLLGVSVSFVYDRTRQNAVDPIPHFKLGKYIRFDLEQIDQWLEERTK
jgi:excisionase family DNA binding protein